MPESPFDVHVEPDKEGLLRCVRCEEGPDRVHHIELFIDWEVQEEVCRRYGVLEGLDPDDPHFMLQRQAALQRFLGYDYVRQGLDALNFPLKHCATDDTAELARAGGRNYMEEHAGPITSWKDFEAYPWPDPEAATTEALEWYSEHLPEGMCIIGSGGFAHFAEHLTWLMGYESLCFSLYDQRDLVEAISARLTEIYRVSLRRMLEFERVEIVWGSDDMGFRTGTLISPDDMRRFVLPGHKLMAEMSHEAGRPYLLHSCGNLTEIMEDLIEDVGIDARHSFEDVIEPVVEAYDRYGERISILGGMDVDFLSRAGEDGVRARVRRTLEHCMPAGGYCLGSGNSVTNYVPVDNFLAMLDEGRKFATS
jgi:uroporphyrinogen decarboxylase